MYAIVLLFQLGLFPYGGYEALLPVDPSTLPLDAMIETYRRLKTADPNDPGSSVIETGIQYHHWEGLLAPFVFLMLGVIFFVVFKVM